MEALLSASFGTSYEETRAKTIDAVEERLRGQYPDWAFYSAWTSGRIIAKVKKERGEHHDTLDEAFERMAADGVDDVVVSTMCLMQGAESKKIETAAKEWAKAGKRSIRVARPLLSSAADRKRVAQVLCDEFAAVGEGDALLLMGHGSPYAPNDVYRDLQSELHASGKTSFFVATVEGEPTFEDALPLLKESGARCVYLAPLMMVAGDHAANDLAGDDDDSWASLLAAQGFQVKPVLKGLGEYAGIHQLVCDHVNDALMIREVALRG